MRVAGARLCAPPCDACAPAPFYVSASYFDVELQCIIEIVSKIFILTLDDFRFSSIESCCARETTSIDGVAAGQARRLPGAIQVERWSQGKMHGPADPIVMYLNPCILSVLLCLEPRQHRRVRLCRSGAVP